MRHTPDDSSLLLPERARLLHIGPMKTGTTSAQSAASSLRGQLLKSGVRYPGTTLNHRLAVGAFMGKAVSKERRAVPIGQIPDGAVDEGIPPMSEWNRMMAEIDADKSRRVWISHEFIAEASAARAHEFAEALGERIHVLITLRNPAEILPSLWTQLVKSGRDDEFDMWLRRVFNLEPERPMGLRFRRSQHQARLVERWASVVGPEKVTVVVVDKSRPALLLQSFEQLLGLRNNTLTPPTTGSNANRSLSLPEAQMLVRINQISRSESVGWGDYAALVRGGAIKRLLDNREPAEDEKQVLMPEWAAKRARKRGRLYAKRIRETGVRIVGDLEALFAPVPTRDDDEPAVNAVPMDVAVESVVGTIAASIDKGVFESTRGRGPKQRLLSLASHLIRAADSHTSRDIIRAANAEARRKAAEGVAKLRR